MADNNTEATTHADLYHRHGEADSSKWVEADAVTGRDNDTPLRGEDTPAVPNSSFAERRQVTSAENKAVQGAATKTLDDMTKAELLDEADRRGVEVNKSATKAEILDALNG